MENINITTNTSLDDLTFELVELQDVTALPETAASSGSGGGSCCGSCSCSSCSSCCSA